jgi:hypothetical protein
MKEREREGGWEGERERSSKDGGVEKATKPTKTEP